MQLLPKEIGDHLANLCENQRLYEPPRHLTLLESSQVILCSHGWTSAVTLCGYLTLPKEIGDHLANISTHMVMDTFSF